MQMGCGGRESEVRSAEGKSPEGESPEGESQKCGGRNTNLNINPLDLRPGGGTNYSSAFSKPIPPSGNVIYIC
jgi:hypothetical protein